MSSTATIGTVLLTLGLAGLGLMWGSILYVGKAERRYGRCSDCGRICTPRTAENGRGSDDA